MSGQEPPPNPEMVKMQMEQQKLQIQAQTAQQKAESDAAKAQVDAQKAQVEAQKVLAEIELIKAKIESELIEQQVKAHGVDLDKQNIRIRKAEAIASIRAKQQHEQANTAKAAADVMVKTNTDEGGYSERGLVSNNQDNYFNRVQASLNFVQFLPYGLPEFDTDEWYYFGISTPPESFILGYSDCDSKSVFFASILSQLIPIENIILVTCTVNSGNEASNGEHMMVAVSDLGIEGESLTFKDKKYLLLETTRPMLIGQFDWTSFKANSIVNLN
jgi:hypothetical protein